MPAASARHGARSGDERVDDEEAGRDSEDGGARAGVDGCDYVHTGERRPKREGPPR